MSMHVPALHAPPIPADADIDPAEAAAERRRDLVETLVTVAATMLAVTIISVVGVALELV